ncbi:hypothetical protein GX48_05782 [Paracoccidioides brasiliensis]|nr:hypothetical protein GX48_05782 [Paracoccidioides brasiliensis]
MVFAPKTSNSNSENCSGKCLPNATPCLSYWQRTTRPFPLLYASREEKVVSSRLTISGINWKDVIILEARKAESGAGSQNIGSHTARSGDNMKYLNMILLLQSSQV